MRALIACVVATSLAVAACATSPGAAKAPKTAAATSTEPDEASSPVGGEGADDEDGAPDAEDVEPSGDGANGASGGGPCGDDMVLVEAPAANGAARRWCIDKYEASLVEILADGTERPFPHYSVVDGHDVVAVSRPHVYPQGFISELQAEDACTAAHKRLCTHDEWKTACMGPSRTTFPYGAERRAGACHDLGKSAVGAVFGAKALASPVAVAGPSKAAIPSKAAGPDAAHAASKTTSARASSGKRAHVTRGRAASTTKARASKTGSAHGAGAARGSRAEAKAGHAGSANKPAPVRRTGRKSAKPASIEASVWTRLNDPALGQVDGALSRTGEHPECVNGFGAFDMVGNLHEWVATDRSSEHGIFAGGYYLDTSINGDGCNYKTQAHAHEYHDYSTGFRCCRDVR